MGANLTFHRLLWALSLCGPLAASLAGCPSRDISALDITQTGEVLKDIPISTDIDILFVIDNSSSTADKQDLFAANFRKFIEALDAFPNGRPNVHIGVVSSTVDLGVSFQGCPTPNTAEDGRLQYRPGPQTSGCSGPTGASHFIIDVKNADGVTRTTNYAGDLETTFACIARLDAKGCGFEAPLEAMKRALDGTHAADNTGFLRPEAFLAVVILTDEDDCSMRDPGALFAPPDSEAGAGDFRCQPRASYTCDQEISPTAHATYTNCKVKTETQGSLLHDPTSYTAFLNNLKGGSSRVVVGLIAGDTETTIMTDALVFPDLQNFKEDPALMPSCMATINGKPNFARPAIRLTNFLAPFASHGLFSTVCKSDYSQTLTDIGKLLFSVVTPCLEGDVDMTDLDSAEPGLQLGCTVSDVQNVGTTSQTEVVIQRCPMTAVDTPAASPRPCWWVKSAPTVCTSGSHLELHVERDSPPASGTTIQARCGTSN